MTAPDTEHRPPISTQRTVARRFGQPPEGTSGRGTTGLTHALRMAGKGDTIPRGTGATGGGAIHSPAAPLRVLSLFAGIGGFDLGLERTGGFQTVAFCEIEPFAQKVLAKHWQHVPCYTDVRELTSERLHADGIAVDVICGGFPCQDISYAGLGAGLAGERSGLFYEVARLVGELGPRFVILENVSALLSRGLDAVLGTLASLGYDAEWHCIPASALGAHHRRERVWIIAYPQGDGFTRGAISDQDRNALEAAAFGVRIEPAGNGADDSAGALADATSFGQQGQGQPFLTGDQTPILDRQAVDAFAGSVGDFWRTEPDVGRVANGVPDRAHRLKALGNAVVPQIPELIGRAILEAINNRGSQAPDMGSSTAGDSFPGSVAHENGVTA